MIESDAVLNKMRSLRAAGKSFVLATVVRSEAPTSAKPGAKAIVTAEGDVEGWIGGGCAQPAVIRTAKQALQDGAPRLIRISPEGGETPEPGIVDFGMRCHSGGTLDIFIEPVIARPALFIIGASPAAQVLCGLAQRVGFTVTAAFPGADRQMFPDADRIVDNLDGIEISAGVPTFVVVATQGKRDEAGLEAALASGAARIAFIASRRKADKLKQYLRERGHDDKRVDAIEAPAGIDIKAVTPEEIALSVLAGIVKARRGADAAQAADAPAAEVAQPAQAIDPVCGMTVATANAEHRSEFCGRTYYFCCAHCRHTFEKDPRKYLQAQGA